MRFDRESWRKLYVAESMDHRIMSLFARGLRDYLLRLAESDGTLFANTENPARDLEAILGAKPAERKSVASAVQELMRVGYLSHEGGRLWITKFEEAQEARSPGAKRQAAWRANNPELTQRRAKLSNNYELVRKLRQHDGPHCSYCGTELDFRVGKTPNGASLDHIIPMTRGGSDDEENLVLACRACNEIKNNRTPDEAGFVLRNRETLIRRGVDVSACATADVSVTSRETSQLVDETRRDETTTNAGAAVVAVACPRDLVLAGPQRGTLETALIPGWAIDELTTRFVAKHGADPDDRRTLVVWRKCLSTAISSDWNNLNRRPKKPDGNANVILWDTEAGRVAQ